MKNQTHDRARDLITASSVEGLTAAESSWLQNHLVDCRDCSRYAQAASTAREALHSISFKVDPALIATTQMRVQLRARELREREQQLIPVWISCIVALVVAAVTTPYLWQACAWVGGRASLAPAFWQAGFVAFWLFPGMLALVVVLMIRGSGSRTAAE